MKITEQADGRVQIREFEGLRTRAAYAKPPHSSVDGTLLGQLSVLERAAEEYDTRVLEARGNKLLSPEGVRSSTREHRGRVGDAVAVLTANAKDAHQQALAKREALFAPPQLDPSDAAGAALDREIREGFASLSEHQRPIEMVKDRNLHALLRSPFDTPHSKAAEGAWRERVGKARAEEIAKYDRHAETAEWLFGVAQAYQTVLAKTQAELGEPKETAGDVAKRLRAEAAVDM